MLLTTQAGYFLTPQTSPSAEPKRCHYSMLAATKHPSNIGTSATSSPAMVAHQALDLALPSPVGPTGPDSEAPVGVEAEELGVLQEPPAASEVVSRITLFIWSKRTCWGTPPKAGRRARARA